MQILLVDSAPGAVDELMSAVAGVDLSEGVPGILRAASSQEAVSLLRREPVDLVLFASPCPAGIAAINEAKNDADAGHICLCGRDGSCGLIDSIKGYYARTLATPVSPDVLVECLLEADGRLQAQKEINACIHGGADTAMIDASAWVQSRGLAEKEMAVFSRELELCYRRIQKVLNFPQVPVLIVGETGAGKDVLAKYCHFGNPAAQDRYVAINCSNLSRDLFEAELFGYEKGAFTGADTRGHDGKLKAAGRGTLFFDEIAEIPLDLQAKLLRVLEGREYYKIGSNERQEVHARLVFATNRDPAELLKKGLFREDLYFRLSVCEVRIPSLRERKEAIIPLSLFILHKICREFGYDKLEIERGALKLLETYPFNGNVRELKNVLTKASLFGGGAAITREELSLFLPELQPGSPEVSVQASAYVLPDAPFDLDAMMNSLVRQALHRFNGNRSMAAKFLGVTRAQLYGRFKDALEAYERDTNG